MLLVSLPLCTFVLYHTRETNYEVEGVIHVEDVGEDQIHGAALPKGHRVDAVYVNAGQIEEKRDVKDGAIAPSV